VAEPLTLEEVKLNLRVDDVAEDGLIASLIATAREHVEDLTGLVLTPRTITESVRSTGCAIDLASWPVTAIVAIRTIDGASETTVASDGWSVTRHRRPARVRLTAPAMHGGDIEIDLQAGFATPADVPATVKQAMHLLIAHFYTNRSAVEAGTSAAAVEIPLGVDALLRRYRQDMV